MNKLVFVIIGLFFFGCSLNLTNVSTNGKSSDVVDSEQKTDPVVSPNIEIPLPVI